MKGNRFDATGRWLAAHGSRRATVRAVTTAALAIGLGRFDQDEAVAKCKIDGQKCKKNKECCSKKCKGKACRCRSLGETCNAPDFGNPSENTCCGADHCWGNACGQYPRCCSLPGNACQSNCDCCYPGAECHGGECCLGKGANCWDTVDKCCDGMVCIGKGFGKNCQPIVLNP